MTFFQTPMLEQSLGIPFDSTDFTMNIAQTGTLLTLSCTSTMGEWTEEEEEEVEEEGDDTFEQYLFGEDDE